MAAWTTESWTAPAIPESVQFLRGEVARFASGASVGDPPLSDVRLAVSEAVTNVVLHGYVSQAEPGPIDVTATIDGGALLVSIADEGSGMAPRLDSPGMGVGLPLITSVADRLEIRACDPHGTELLLGFDF